MTTSKKNAVLEIYVPFKDDGRDKLVRVGTMFHTDKGKTMINIEATPTKCGDWDGKSYLAMRPDNSDVSDIFPSRKSQSGSTLPVFEAKAVFETVEGRGTRTHYINCGVGFRGRTRDDGTCKSVVVTLSSKPTGDTGDWDGFTYVGFPLESATDKSESDKPESAGKRTAKTNSKEVVNS